MRHSFQSRTSSSIKHRREACATVMKTGGGAIGGADVSSEGPALGLRGSEQQLVWSSWEIKLRR